MNCNGRPFGGPRTQSLSEHRLWLVNGKGRQ